MHAHQFPAAASAAARAHVGPRVIGNAAETARRRNAYLATVAHELRNALAPLSTAVDILDRRKGPADGVAELLPVARRQLRQLAALTDDLLDVSRAVTSEFRMTMRIESLNDLVCSVASTWRVLADAKGQTISIDIPVATPFVRADRMRFSQALQNVIGNAVKFTPEGGRISVRMYLAGPEVKICVSDTGIGIPAVQLGSIFELFFSVRDEAAPGSGFGIGLALARQLIELHGGTIAACSEVGVGTSFTITLPHAVQSGAA